MSLELKMEIEDFFLLTYEDEETDVVEFLY